MSKILVTGVNGFVGHHLAKELSEAKFEVVGVGGTDRFANDNLFVDTYLTIDLTDENQVAQIDFTDVHGVIHLAGLAAVGPSFDNPQLYMRSNPGMEINLFEAAQRQGAHPKFVIISSGSLYDAKAELPITEATQVLPNSPYAVSKLSQEQMAHYYESRGFEVVIARPFNHIGPGQGLGFIAPDLASQIVACEKGETDNVLVGNLDARRDYTDVRDIARAYRLLLDKGLSGETYNICTGRSLSGHEILDTLLARSTAKPTVRQDPERMRPSDTPDIYGSHDKLTRDTGWEPTIEIRSTLEAVLEDWRSR